MNNRLRKGMLRYLVADIARRMQIIKMYYFSVISLKRDSWTPMLEFTIGNM